MVSPTVAAKRLRLAARLVADPAPTARVEGPVLALARQSLQVDAVSVAIAMDVTKQMVSKVERTGAPPATAASYLDTYIALANAQRLAAR